MKIAPRSVEAYLDRPEASNRAALFYGPDSGLVRERAQKLKNILLKGETDPFATVEIEEAKLVADPALLADELSAISLMAPKRVIHIQGAGDKTGKIIEAAAEFFNDSVFIIVSAGELPTRSSLRAWFEKEPNCAAIACYKDEVRDVQEVVRKHFDQAGISLPRDTVDYLASQLGNDRYVTRQELEKIVTYMGDEKTISLEEVRALVEYNRDTHMDELVNAVADKNLPALEKTLTLLAREAASPVAYLRAAQRYFNRLYAMRALVNGGQSVESVIASARPPVFFRQVPIMTRHLHAWDIPQLARALKLLVEAELACKTSDLPPLPASARKLMQVTQLR